MNSLEPIVTESLILEVCNSTNILTHELFDLEIFGSRNCHLLVLGVGT